MSDDCSNANAYFEEIDRLFPLTKFPIAIDLSELAVVLTSGQFLAVRFTNTCYCFDNSDYQGEYIYIHKPDGNITAHDVINQMIKVDHFPKCNHNLLEGFDKKTDMQFEASFGS